MQILPVIMAGGKGTRLWPLSRSQYPKQFLALADNQKTLFQQTIERIKQLDTEPALVICNEEHRFIAAEQLRLIGNETATILLEPCGRNTAPTVTLAALHAIRNGEDPLLLVMPADHRIDNPIELQQTFRQAFSIARQGEIVTFGIQPTLAETGYGYIKKGHAIDTGNAFRVVRFVEKPDQQTAESYVESGDYFWNSGIFIFKASRFLNEAKLFVPDIVTACETALNNATADLGFIRISMLDFSGCPDESIDYAIMEKINDAVVIPMSVSWSDLGTWAALLQNGHQDTDGNVTVGDVMVEQCSNTYIHSPRKLTAAIGLDNHIVVNTDDALLIVNAKHIKEVKTIVNRLEQGKRTEHQFHTQVFRPWGFYENIDRGTRYLVKRITVYPGASLSTQLHHHRAEHWIVVKGTAKVTNGEKNFYLTENQSSYIPIGQIHKLENPGSIPLELIEVQSGSYLGEDDIVRLDDKYGRD